jgi:hypothetical protein
VPQDTIGLPPAPQPLNAAVLGPVSEP